MRPAARSTAFLVPLTTLLVAAAGLIFRTDMELERADGLLHAAVL
jgi:hypothetical protein